ncbi:Exo endo phos domain containing protein [Trichuris trichiura]|uniref:Exo endo phos domain containing protein n=1 Tax=Trichuris trichiura TaxID=36087 RepID=A0A077YZT4_TRITR|nr:Exo endo phos domain containing protein [Trichuris trichiura]
MQVVFSAFDLVNVHLFHDSCNIAAVEMVNNFSQQLFFVGLNLYLQSPSVFAKQRECGLKFILDQINKCLPVEAPLVIFGDFNFRLDTKCLVENLLAPPSVAVQTVTQGDDGQPRVQYKHVRSGEDQLFKLDREPKNHLGLREFPINFLPRHANIYPSYVAKWFFSFSYPFMEDIDKAGVYMNTRAPAWCDRVFLNDHAWRLAQVVPDPPVYDIIGKDTCMGDHKVSHVRSQIICGHPETTVTQDGQLVCYLTKAIKTSNALR